MTAQRKRPAVLVRTLIYPVVIVAIAGMELDGNEFVTNPENRYFSNAFGRVSAGEMSAEEDIWRMLLAMNEKSKMVQS